MKLYLSSYHLGNDSKKLIEMIGPNKKTAIITNALDFSLDYERKTKGIWREKADLQALGLLPEELDLRNYFGKSQNLKKKLSEFGFVWAIGGNTFILRRAMHESGFDSIIKEYLGKDELVYGGYSAGVCAITPTLKGLELVDDPVTLPKGYKNQTIWDGVGLINYCFAPHYKSDHPESKAVNNLVQYFVDKHMPYKALRDGEVIIDSV